MNPTADADLNLLFGILALQMDFITRDQLVAAMNAWVLRKATPLGQILVEQGALSDSRRSLLEPLVSEHVRQNGGDTARSLAALGSVDTACKSLEAVADPDVRDSLARVPVGRDREEDPFATVQGSLGLPTSAGSRFRILRPHAKGGLGQVSVAVDAELDRPVALKEIQERHADDPASRARFVREAEVTGKLEHPGIIPVYGLGHDALTGRPYYAMRFVKGDSLHDAIRRYHKADGARPDPGERTLQLRGLLGRFTDVCNAIAYAHSRGVLHRDIKPGNVMLGPFGETLVVDWGLAKPLGWVDPSHASEEGPLRVSTSGDSEGATVAGTHVGTPGYMSPEQAEGRLDALGPASDVYSLGATLYQLLTGRAPFTDDELVELLGKVRRGEFPPPRSVLPAVPRPLEAICLKAMALKPEDRYPSPRDLARDVECWLADEPILARRDPFAARLARWGRRHKPVVSGLAVLLITATVALSVGLVRVDRERKRAESAEAKALRTALMGFHKTADASLAAARLLHVANDGRDARGEALGLIREATALRTQAGKTLAALGNATGDLAREEDRRWSERTAALRDEAIRWLLTTELRPGRPVLIRSLPQNLMTPPAALSADGSRVAVLDPESGSVTVVGSEGVVISQAAYAPSPNIGHHYGDKVRFLAEDALEIETPSEILTFRITNSKLDRRPRPESRALPPSTPPGGPVYDLHNSLYVVWGDAREVHVHPVGKGSEQRTVWRTNAGPQSSSPDNELSQYVVFGHDPQSLFIVTNLHLLMVDLASGSSVSVPLRSETTLTTILELKPLPGGPVTLQVTKPMPKWMSPGAPREGQRSELYLVRWASNLSALRSSVLNHPLPVRAADVATDGSVATGDEDLRVRLWAGREQAWAMGRPGLGRSAPPYPWWGFMPGGRQPLVVERRELLPDGGEQLRMEWFDPAAGGLLRSFPTAGPNRVVGVSPDRRFALVTSEGRAGEPTHHVWSIEEDRQLAPPIGDGQVAWVEFSPRSQWMLVARPPRTLEVWELPGMRRVGELPFVEKSLVQFDPDERLVVVIPPLPDHPSKFLRQDDGKFVQRTTLGRVIELGSARVVSRLEGLGSSPDVLEFGFLGCSSTHLVGRVGPLYGLGVHGIIAWSLANGKSTPLGKSRWDRDSSAQFGPEANRVLLCGKARDNPLLISSHEPTHVELWDLASGTVLRQTDLSTYQSSPGLCLDRDAIYLLSSQPVFGGHGVRSCWRWSDGSDTSPGSRVAVSCEAEFKFPARMTVPAWVLWAGGKGEDLHLQIGLGIERTRLAGTADLWPPKEVASTQRTDKGQVTFLRYQRDWSSISGRVTPDGRCFALVVNSSWREGDAGPPPALLAGLWDTRTGRRIAELPRDHLVVGVDSTGRWVVTLGRTDRRVVVWDTRSGQAVHRPTLPLPAGPQDFEERPEPIRFGATPDVVKAHPGGRRLAVLAQGMIRVWDAESGRTVGAVDKPGHFTPVTCVAQHAETGLVASGDGEGVVLLWDREQGRFLRSLSGHSTPIAALTFSPDGSRLASASDDGTVILWEPGGRTVWTFRDDPPARGYCGLAFLPDGRSLVAGSKRGCALVLDAASGARRSERKGDTAEQRSVALSPSGGWLATSGVGGRVQLWRTDQDHARHAWTAAPGVTSLAFVGGDDLLAAGGQDVSVYDSRTGQRMLSLDVARPPVRQLCTSPGANELVVVDQSGDALVLDLKSLLEQLSDLGVGLPTHSGATPSRERQPRQ
jgi:WD40 repeat protein